MIIPPEVAAASADPRKRFGHFVLLAELGAGGMGQVWRAWDERLKRLVALKTLLPGSERDAALVKRFHREAEAVARLRHPGIVSVFEAGEYDGRPFIAMELIAGKSLHRAVASKEVDLREAVRIVRDCALAVQHAHDQGVLHRDLKPANVMLDASGEPRILDFGLARLSGERSKLTKTGASMGTPAYMPPEQAGGEEEDKVDARSDVYALGATLYHAITGRAPFEGAEYQVLTAVLTRAPLPPSKHEPQAAGDLDTICLTCLEKDPRDRYETARELARELDRWLAGRAIEAQPPSRTELLARHVQRDRGFAVRVAASAVAVLGVAALVGKLVIDKRNLEAQIAAAQRESSPEPAPASPEPFRASPGPGAASPASGAASPRSGAGSPGSAPKPSPGSAPKPSPESPRASPESAKPSPESPRASPESPEQSPKSPEPSPESPASPEPSPESPPSAKPSPESPPSAKPSPESPPSAKPSPESSASPKPSPRSPASPKPSPESPAPPVPPAPSPPSSPPALPPTLGTWTKKLAGDPRREPLALDAVACDGKRVYGFGGAITLGDDDHPGNRLWVYDPTSRAPAWTLLHDGKGPAPAPRQATSLVWTGAHLLLFGGGDREGKANGNHWNDLWSFDVASERWTKLTPAGDPPSARCAQAACWAEGRLVVFGGGVYDGNPIGDLLDDVWVYDERLDRWLERVPGKRPGSPPRMSGGTLVWDPDEKRALLFGGVSTVNNDDRVHGAVWALDLEKGVWDERTPGPTDDAREWSQPAPRSAAGGAWDAEHKRMLVYGGLAPWDLTSLGDLWAYEPRARRWTCLAPEGGPMSRSGLLAWDGKRAIVTCGFRGHNFGEGERFPNDLWWFVPSK